MKKIWPQTGACPEAVRCPPFYVADATYTATCPGGVDFPESGGTTNGPVGPSVTITRQYRSTVSVEHARSMALALAKREAELELRCQFRAVASAMPYCDAVNLPPVFATVDSFISQADADYRAAVAANDLATAACE